MLKKLKPLLADDSFYMASLLVLVGISSFGLGRLSVAPEAGIAAATVSSALSSEQGLQKAVVNTEIATNSATVTERTEVSNQVLPFVASKSGTKYHKVTCPGAKQIKVDNKIYFATPTEAKAAGYTPAANCPGLQ